MSDRNYVRGRLPTRRFVVPEEGGELPGWYARDAVERIFFDGIRGYVPHLTNVSGLVEITRDREHLATAFPGHDFRNQMARERYCLEMYWVLQEERTIVRTYNEIVRRDFLTRITPAYRFRQYVWENPVFRFDPPDFGDAERNNHEWRRINRWMTRVELRRRNGRFYDSFYNGY